MAHPDNVHDICHDCGEVTQGIEPCECERLKFDSKNIKRLDDVLRELEAEYPTLFKRGKNARTIRRNKN